jgi:hypothetical protein
MRTGNSFRGTASLVVRERVELALWPRVKPRITVHLRRLQGPSPLPVAGSGEDGLTGEAYDRDGVHAFSAGR